VTDLGSAAVPVVDRDDHLRGPADAPLVVLYADFECPYCAVSVTRLREATLRVAFRHFPVRSKHPRAWAAACAAEAASAQSRFWEMHDALFADQGRLEDPHLWDRARRLGLDVDRFEADRRSDSIRERVARDFYGGVRAGVVTTPTLVLSGRLHPGVPAADLLSLATGGSPTSR
jgi:protein-disulfide isomerase